MPRVAQPDLFAPAPAPDDEPPPFDELRAILARLRAAERLPFADAAAAMADELRVVGLGRRAGPEWAALASAILDEMERLHALTNRRAWRPTPVPDAHARYPVRATGPRPLPAPRGAAQRLKVLRP